MPQSNNQITVDGFLPPDQLFLDEPIGIRAIAFECLARNFHKLFGEKTEQIVTTLMQVQKISRTEAFIRGAYYFEQTRKIYADEAEKLSRPLRKIMYQAMEEEKNGNINKAIQLFEEISDNAFPPSTPYERLRIIYTKQHSYEDAIRVCRRYIEVLLMVKEFWAEYPNIDSIRKYQDYINKLSAKLKANR